MVEQENAFSVEDRVLPRCSSPEYDKPYHFPCVKTKIFHSCQFVALQTLREILFAGTSGLNGCINCLCGFFFL